MKGIGVTSLLLIAALSRAQSAPAGWRTNHPAPDVLEFVPPDLQAGEVFRVDLFPAEATGGKKLADWITAAIGRDPIRPGKPKGAPQVKPQANGAVIVVQPFDADSKAVYGLYTGVVNGGKGRLVRVLMTSETPVYDRYKDSVNTLIKAARDSLGPATTGNTTTATGGGAKVPPEVLPLLPEPLRKLKLGGPLKPGIYEGQRLYGKDLQYKMRVYVYADGEYRILTKHEDDQDYKLAEFGEDELTYNEATGKVNFGRTWSLGNNRNDPADEFTLYFTAPDGSSLIYGSSDRGISYQRTILAYARPLDRDSPKQEKLAQAEAEAAAKRFKWVTAPGKGLKLAQIHAIYHEGKNLMDGMGGAVAQNNVYILLKDGTIYDGLPCAPDQLDVPLSRRREPEKWGHWKPSGGKVLVTWPDSNGKWAPLAGERMRPGATGLKLTGRYGTGESRVSLAGSSWSLWGVTFANGRFVKDSRGGAGNSLMMQNSGAPVINTTYDDDGSATSAVGDGFVVATNRKVATRRTRSGTYQIDGYTLTLKYDDGRIVRHPFFYDPKNTSAIWFEGAYLEHEEKR